MRRIIGRRMFLTTGMSVTVALSACGLAKEPADGERRLRPKPPCGGGNGGDGDRDRDRESGRDADPVPMTWERALEQYRYGVALAGLEFGDNVFPGRWKAEIVEPPENRYPYYASRGLRTVRLPYLWERFQPDLFGEIDGELDLLARDAHVGRVLYKDVVRRHLDLAYAHEMKVLLDPHNYGARALKRKGEWLLTGGTGRFGRFAIGSPEVPVAAFADFVAKLAAEYGNHPALLGFDIMNEPTMMPGEGEGWAAAAQAAIDATRRVNKEVLLFIEGYRYANPYRWEQYNPTIHELNDPSDRLIFSAHLYFDNDHSGRYLDDEALRPGVKSTVERTVSDIQPFFDWLEKHGKRGHIGEFGVPDTLEWQPIVQAFLTSCTEKDIIIHAWADWPNNLGYVLQTNNIGGRDREVVRLLSAASRAICE